jgi:O-antigen/teichoic acid export membrane protein
MGFSAQVGRSAVWAAAGQIITALLSVINFAVVGRFVGPNAYGAFLVAMTVLAACQWLAQSAYREPLVQAAELDDGQINSVFTFSLLVGLLLCVSMIGAALYMFFVKQEPVVAVCVAVLALKLLLDATTSVPLALRVRKMEFKFIAKVGLVANLLGTAVTFGMLAAGLGAVSLALSQLAASALLLLILLRTGQRRYHLGIQKDNLAILRGYSPHIILWQAIEAVGQTVDRYFIASRLTLTDLGLYGFGKRLNDVIIDVLVGATSSVALPAFSKLQNDHERLRNAFLKAVRTMLLVVLPVLASLAVTAEDFVPLLFGAKWIGAMEVYRCFLLLGVIQGVGILQGGLLRSRGKPGVWSRYQLAQCAANVVVLSLVAGQSIEVIAGSIVARTYLLWGWVVWQTCRTLQMQFGYYVVALLKPLLVAAVATACGFWLRQYFQDLNLLLRLIINGTLVFGIFGALASVFLRSDVLETLALARQIVSRKSV